METVKSEALQIVYEQPLGAGAEHYLQRQLDKEAALHQFSAMVLSGILIKNQHAEILAGLSCLIYHGCMYIDNLWVCSDLRNQGWGKKLLLEAEKLAKQQGCTFITLSTMEWQAPEFYKKLGFTVEFIREGYKNNTKMYLFRKDL